MHKEKVLSQARQIAETYKSLPGYSFVNAYEGLFGNFTNDVEEVVEYILAQGTDDVAAIKHKAEKTFAGSVYTTEIHEFVDRLIRDVEPVMVHSSVEARKATIIQRLKNSGFFNQVDEVIERVIAEFERARD